MCECFILSGTWFCAFFKNGDVPRFLHKNNRVEVYVGSNGHTVAIKVAWHFKKIKEKTTKWAHRTTYWPF